MPRASSTATVVAPPRRDQRVPPAIEPSRPNADNPLATPVQYLKGVGPQRAELLAKLDLHVARDVLFFFPRDYQDLSNVRSIAELVDGEVASIVGQVEEVDHRTTANGNSVLGVLIRQDRQHLRALWFNQPYLKDRFQYGQRLLLYGRAMYRGLAWEMHHPRVQAVEEERGGDRPTGSAPSGAGVASAPVSVVAAEAQHHPPPDAAHPVGEILPVYPLCEGLNQGILRKVTAAVVPLYAPVLDEVFPADYLAAHQLLPIAQALPQIHFPTDMARLAEARRRFVYQELFVMQLGLALRRRQQLAGSDAPPLEATARIDARIRRLFPFEFTAGQNAAVAEIAADAARTTPMNRLLQGDVGSGKTAVAVYAMLLSVAHGCQAVLMAPTEILARQHFRTLGSLLTASQVRFALLTGGLPAAEKRALLDKLAVGELDVVIGTHAVLEPDVRFPRLGLVVIDEQHKFGVRERARLKQAGSNPHYLVMTATPIPRTVAMTQFGDLDVSTLREAPAGRQKVNSYLATPDLRTRWWDFFRRKLREGRQGYVIVPLVSESEKVAGASLDAAYESLANGELEAFRLGCVHGRLDPAEKDAQVEAFRRGETQVLIATSVVEVGIDVANATLMTIEGGERFGLSQLHQLRGRVGRGAHPGFCCVFADPQTDDARQRLEAFVATTDGFKLAETDFDLRGPGDLLGSRQHGLPPLRIADLRRDGEVLDEARRDAQALIAADADLSRPEHGRLRKMVLSRYGRVLELGDVG